MKGSNGRLAFGVFMGGVGLGIFISLLFAPHSGEETRGLLAKKAGRARNHVGDAVDDLRYHVADAVQHAKSKFREAVQAGKEAYQDELVRLARP